jgi:hypothetical protein
MQAKKSIILGFFPGIKNSGFKNFEFAVSWIPAYACPQCWSIATAGGRE